MLRITPYVSVGAIRFGMSANELVEAMGAPRYVEKNYLGEPDWQYPGLAVRLSVTDEKVVEVGIFPQPEVFLDDIDIFGSEAALRMLIEKDGGPFEIVDFIVLFELGIALTGFHDGDRSQQAATAFAKGRLDNLRPEMRPYSQINQPRMKPGRG